MMHFPDKLSQFKIARKRYCLEKTNEPQYIMIIGIIYKLIINK